MDDMKAQYERYRRELSLETSAHSGTNPAARAAEGTFRNESCFVATLPTVNPALSVRFNRSELLGTNSDRRVSECRVTVLRLLTFPWIVSRMGSSF
jgi:hypothetical protein